MSARLHSLSTLVRRSRPNLTWAAPRRPTSAAPTALSRPHMPPASSRNYFIYHLAAASSPKRAPLRAPTLGRDFWNLVSTDDEAPTPYLHSTKRDSGEDAFFASPVGDSKHDVAFGLADGVGGWTESGVDPSEYSQALCGVMADAAKKHEQHGSGKPLRPLALLQTAYDAVMANPRIAAGGCTASLAVANANGSLETANLGDSGYLVIGPGRVINRSEAQTHAFNTPYQFSKIPRKMRAQYEIFGGAAAYSETPKHSDLASHQLRDGDMVVFATDGVWDNLSAQDTLAVVTKVMEDAGFWFKSHNFPGAETMLNGSLLRSLPRTLNGEGADTYLPGLVAAAVMRAAKAAGLDKRRNGPFAKEVNRLYPREGWLGGKPDDIAVVVCIAAQVEEPDAAGRQVKAKL